MGSKGILLAAVKHVTAKVTYYKNWDNPNIAGFGMTGWAPKFVLLHHTAGTDSYHILSSGYGHVPVPGSNFLVNRDGSLDVFTHFIAYHAGKGGPYLGVAANMMNHYAWGIEIESLGREKDLTDAQIKTVAQLTAGLLKAMKTTDLKRVFNHKTWNPQGKIDTLYSDAWWRAQVAPYMKESSVAEEWPVGKQKLLEIKKVTVKPGTYTPLGKIDLPKGRYFVTVEQRLPAGTWARFLLARDGWGSGIDPKTNWDVTDADLLPPAPDGKATSYTRHHQLNGGGPLLACTKLYVPSVNTIPEIINIVYKAYRLA